MPRFTLELELGNDAMRTRGDVADALELVAVAISDVSRDELFSEEHVGLDFGIRDSNGNKAGTWWVSRS